MSVRNAQASNWVAERAEATASAFDLKGSSKSYTSFSRAFSAGDTVFYSAHDEQGNREAGYGVFNGSTEITRNPTATLFNNVYNSNSPSKVSFSGEVTVACTFNASAFNTLWKALDAIDPDGDGGINIPPELIEGLVDTLNSKADQVDLEKEIQDRIDGDQALQDQIDALDPDGDLVIDWSEIDGKPTEFPPAAHTQDWSTITNTPSEYPPEDHTHEQGDVDGLESRLEAIEDSITSGGGFVDAPNDGRLYGRQSEAWAEVVIPDGGASSWDEIADKPTEFPPAAHNQGWDTITGKPADYPPSAHGHEIAEINGLSDALTDAGAPTAWNDVTGKPAEFPPEDHTHLIADITDFDPADYQPAGEYVGEAPNDGKPYVRKSEAWEEMPTTGGGDPLWEQNLNDIYYNAGNVGIGTDNPAHSLDVNGEIGLTNASAQKLYWDVSGSYLNWIECGGGAGTTYMRFATGNAEAMRIDANGYCGIGTDFPEKLLDVTDKLDNSEAVIRVNNDGIGDALNPASAGIEFGHAGTLRASIAAGVYGNDFMAFRVNNNTERMRISANGNVGIGTDNPANNGLTISQTGLTRLRFESKGVRTWDTQVNGTSYEIKDASANNTGGLVRMTIDSTGRVGIGGQPSRSAKEIAKEAKDTLARWKSTFDERLKAEPKADKKAITLEITDDEFDTFPTEETLVERLQERNIGGGSAKLQVAGDGYFYNSIVVNGGKVWAEGRSGVGFTSPTAVIPVDSAGGYTTGTVDLGLTNHKWKDGHFSGTIYGTVADVPAHVKAITPTQIANWDAGTGGGGDGATTDGRISDTQITHWDTAYGWGNHATAGYQPAGSYAASNHNHNGVYQPAGSYAAANHNHDGTYAPASHTHSQYLTSSDLSGYATESWVNSQGFAKGSFVPTSGNTTISGTLTATDFVATSDERMKDEITPMPVGLIDDIKPAQWTWKDSGKKSAGVIAQQLQEIGLDDFVSEGEDGMLGVNYNALTSVLLAEVIALKKQVQELSK